MKSAIARLQVGSLGPWCALFAAGLGWGTAGPLIRYLSEQSFGAFSILFFRLLVSGLFFVPMVFVQSKRTRQSGSHAGILAGITFDSIQQVVESSQHQLKLALGMIVYYITAILAFRNLPMASAVVVIGSSPVIAATYELIKGSLQRRKLSFSQIREPAANSRSKSKTRSNSGARNESLSVLIGPVIAVGGLLFYFQLPGLSSEAAGVQWSTWNSVGLVCAFTCSAMAVINARYMRGLKSERRPSASEVSAWTAVVGVPISLLALFLGHEHQMFDFTRAESNLTSILFAVAAVGVVATLIPGWAITFASRSLPPVATSTSSVQLQVWTILIGYAVLGESLSGGQLIAIGMVLVGLALTIWNQRGQRHRQQEQS